MAYLSLRQYRVGTVAAHTYDAADNGHTCGEGDVISFNPDPYATDTYTWPPCTASFTNDTLPGSLLVCVGVLNADYFGDFVTKVPVLNMDAGLDGWGSGYSFATASIFNRALPCQAVIAGGIAQVPQASGNLLYKANAPIVAAGTLFYGGVNSADWCNNFAYQIILAEFAVVGATLASFSFNNTVPNPGAPLSLPGRLPSDNPSFVIAITPNNPGSAAAPGSGFTLGPASALGSQWQWQEFAPQASGYLGGSGSNFPHSCPGLSGSFELGFNGDVVAGITPVGAFIWELQPAGTPIASVTPSSLTYVDQNLGTVSPAQTVIITNTGSAPLILAAVPLALTGTDAANFGIGIGTTATPSLSIAPGGSAIVEVVFNPVALGLRNAQLVITDNSGGAIGAMQAVPLSGTGDPVVGGLSERNFACNGCFESSSAYGDVLKSLALSMAGFVVPPGDCWRIYAGSYVPPEISLIDSDARGSIKADFRLSARDTCNGVKGQYIPAFLPINPLGPLASSPASPAWKKSDFPPVQRAQYIVEDGGVLLWKDIQLDFTISLWMAQRIARIVLERLRRQVTISLPAKLTGLAALAADTINFLHARWNSVAPPVPTVFQISHTALRMESQADGVPVFGVDLVLRQTDAAVYEFAPPTSPTDFGDYSPYGATGIGAGNVE